MSIARSTLNVAHSAPQCGAVFLSYAHEDAAVARALVQALRGEGLVVWFDESELRGGEAWDASIRRQIRDCSLFVPIISAQTQARTEGYFRIEWKLADERTHAMAEGVLFLLPVVADGTKERDALVPKAFLNVQWSWLPNGEVPAAFIRRVHSLLGPAVGPAARSDANLAVRRTQRPTSIRPSGKVCRPSHPGLIRGTSGARSPGQLPVRPRSRPR